MPRTAFVASTSTSTASPTPDLDRSSTRQSSVNPATPLPEDEKPDAVDHAMEEDGATKQVRSPALEWAQSGCDR
jgi:hypothetical protein